MEQKVLSLNGAFNRGHYFAGLLLSGLVWALVRFIFEGPAKEQFVDNPVIPQVIAILPSLLFYLFTAIKRFRDLRTHAGLQVIFLGVVIFAATSDMVIPDFDIIYPFYERVLNSFALAGVILLLVWPGDSHKQSLSDRIE